MAEKLCLLLFYNFVVLVDFKINNRKEREKEGEFFLVDRKMLLLHVNSLRRQL